jgi:hypothetical protein
MTVRVQESRAMIRWLTVAVHLLAEAGAARRDARVRFLKAQVDILRRKLGGNRVIPSPDDRARLLAIGRERDSLAKNWSNVSSRHLSTPQSISTRSKNWILVLGT